jgi:ribosome-associated protein
VNAPRAGLPPARPPTGASDAAALHRLEPRPGGAAPPDLLDRLRAEARFEPLRASGPGGQNVNKVSNAVQLRFDIRASSLPEGLKAKLLARPDQRISDAGVVVIRAQTHRSLPRNQADALGRLAALVQAVAEPQRPRVPTRPTAGSQRRRLDDKARRGQLKAARRRGGE